MSPIQWKKDLLNSKQIDSAGRISFVRDDPNIHIEIPRRKQIVQAEERERELARRLGVPIGDSVQCSATTSKTTRSIDWTRSSAARKRLKVEDVGYPVASKTADRPNIDGQFQPEKSLQVDTMPHMKSSNSHGARRSAPNKTGDLRSRSVESASSGSLEIIGTPNSEVRRIKRNIQAMLNARKPSQRMGVMQRQRSSYVTATQPSPRLMPKSNSEENEKSCSFTEFGDVSSSDKESSAEEDDNGDTSTFTAENATSLDSRDSVDSAGSQSDLEEGIEDEGEGEGGDEYEHEDEDEDDEEEEEDEDESRMPFRKFVDSAGSDNSEPLVEAFRRYNLRERKEGVVVPKGSSYEEADAPAALFRQRRSAQGDRRKSRFRERNGVRVHDCPCHNLEICLNMLEEVGNAKLAAKLSHSGSAINYTAKVLAALYPQEARIEDLELLCHRIIIDEDQAVHEAAPYAFAVTGWPRDAENYYSRLNKLARNEDMDAVETLVDIMCGEKGIFREKIPCVIDLTGDDSDNDDNADD